MKMIESFIPGELSLTALGIQSQNVPGGNMSSGEPRRIDGKRESVDEQGRESIRTHIGIRRVVQPRVRRAARDDA